MANRDVLALGTSAGGVEALISLAKHFRSDFPASVLVTIHLPSYSRSILDEVLNGAGPLPARFAAGGEKIKKAHIYIAPPDRHLLLDGDQLSLGSGPRENNARPAIDAMLRSVAVCCGPRGVGAVLTGTLGDGASGLWALHQCGGRTVVQDPKDAAFPEMPLTAMNRAQPDHVVGLRDMPALLDSLVQEPAGDPVPVPPGTRDEVGIARDGHSSMDRVDNMDNLDGLGRRSVLSCPDCGGVMWEIAEGDLLRYRCHVGHTYAADLMSVMTDENVRRSFGVALRALEERTALARKLYNQANERGDRVLAQNWLARAHEFEREMKVIRDSIARVDEIAANFEQATKVAAE